MDAPERGALMLVRFIAVALIGWTLVDFGLDWVLHQHNHTGWTVIGIIEDCVPALLGLIVLIKAKALAEWISNSLDN